MVEPQTFPVIPQILQWVNGLTLPTIIVGAFAASRWLTKKEDTITSALASLDTIRTNDLHHVQLTLDEIKDGQQKFAEAAERHKGEMVQAVNSSKDAIVQAILTLRQ